MQKHAQTSRCKAGFIAAWCGALMLLAAPLVTLAAGNTVKFGAPPWPGEKVKAEIASQVLTAIGYDVEVMDAGWAIVLQGVASGDLDVDMGIWKPTQNSMVDPMLESGEIKKVVTNVEDAQYGVVVPQYVCAAGVTSLADLNGAADRFEHKIYGIEAGNDGNKIMEDAIANNVYELGSWKVVPSSETGMLTEARRSIDKEQWIAFLGWKPHWMNIEMDLCYLDDPEAIWGEESSTVSTVANPQFLEAQPNVAAFLRNLVIPASIQSDWIYSYGYQQEPLQKTASDWIGNNLDTIEQWLDGVKSADGKPAFEAFKNNYNAS